MKVVVNGLGGAGGDQDTENTELMAIYSRENQSADKVENWSDSYPGPGCRDSHRDCMEVTVLLLCKSMIGFGVNAASLQSKN